MKKIKDSKFYWILTFILAGFFALTAAGTARAADVDVIRNGNFNNGLDQWVLSLDVDAGWNPLSEGWVSLHPQSEHGYTGKVIYQNLNVSGISGKTFHFSMDMLKVSAGDGNTIAVKVTYVTNSGTREEQIINPANSGISMYPNNPSNVTVQYTFPVDASKLVKIAIVKKDYGEFKVDNIQFTADGITVDSIPGVTDMSTANVAPGGPYGTTLTITGTNFGNTQGAVTLAGSADGVAVTAWSDTSITATVSDPARSGAVRVVADSVESDPNFRFAVTSPNYTVGVIDDKKTAIKGQHVEFLFKVDFMHGFVTQNGISFSLSSSSPAGVNGTFLPALPLTEPGGAVLKIDTNNLSAGEYELTIQAADNGSQLRTVHCTLKVVTIDSVRFFDDPYDSSSPEITQKNVTVQNEFQFGAEAIDNKGNTWSSDVLDFQTSNSGVVQIYNGFWGPQFYAVDDGLATITATAPDGTYRTLAVTVNLDTTYPKITSISLTPSSIANTDDQTSMTFHAESDHALSWIGTDTSGMNRFYTTFLDKSAYSDENTKVSSTFRLANTQYDPQGPFIPVDLGTPLFYASSGGSKRVVPLSVVNGNTTGELKGKVKILDDTFAEMFVLEFYTTDDLNTPAFTRELFLMHEKSSFDIGGIPAKTYKLRLRDDTQNGAQALFDPQWYPNASTAPTAQGVTFTAGQATEGIYFFIRSTPSPAIGGAASYGGNETGTVRVSVVDESGDEADVDDVEASLNGGFEFKNVPDGIYTLYAYLDSDDNQKYTAGEPYGYYLADDGNVGTVVIENGHPSGEVYVILDNASGATGISGTISSALQATDHGSVVIWPHGVIPVDADISLMQGDFPDTAIGVDLTLPPGDTPYQVKNFDWGDGPPIPPGTYDAVLVTSGDQDPDDSGVVRGLIMNVQITRGQLTPSIDFSIAPGGTLSGTVQSDASTPFPIPGADLMLFSGTQSSATFRGFCETDRQGHYEMQNVPARTYFLVVHADGFEDFILAPVNVTTGQTTTGNVSLTSKNGYGQVQLTITDAVTTNSINGEQRAYLLLPDDDEPVGFLQPNPQNPGVFSSYVLPGDYILVGSARGYKPSSETITVANGDNIVKTAQLSGPKDAITAGVNWLLGQQNADGSFGPTWNDPYIMGWSGYATLALLSIRNNTTLGLDQTTVLDAIDNALDDAVGTDGKYGARQYFLGLYHDTDDPGTPWNDVGAFYDSNTSWASVAATPVALERLIALGLPLNDPKVAAATSFLINAQVTALKAKDPMFAGGWRYNPADTDTDNWESPWVIMALMKAGLNPAETHVHAGIDFIRNSQFTAGQDAGLFRYMPGDNWPVSGASAACMTALGFAGVPRTDPSVDLYFQWAQNNPMEIHANNGAASDCYYWSMLAWASSLYNEYETLELTWNIADYAYMAQNSDGYWDNPAPKSSGSQSANSVMFTASALMALAPHTAALAPPVTKTVSGTVYDYGGNIIAGARVEARLNGISVVQGQTDVTGKYQLDVPENQTYTLIAISNGYARASITTDTVTSDLDNQDISFVTADLDNVAPVAGTFVPADGSALTQPAQEISAVLSDDHSGIDPDTIVMKLDGTQVYALYDNGTGKLMMTPVPDMDNGSHTITIDFKDYAQNSAQQASWTFTTDVWQQVPGDVNNDSQVDLEDGILCLQLISSQGPSNIHKQANINGDGKIGLEEAIYILQTVAKLR